MNAFVENVKRKIKTPKTPTEKSLANKERKLRKKKAKLAKKEEDTGPGTIYIGHIPHGFYENEMKKFFSQFGKITNIRLARSRKTLNSKGYAFIQFKSAEVAKIAAEAMNNYLFFEKLLKCEYVPNEKLHPDTFKGWRTKLTSSDNNRRKQNCFKTEDILARNKAKRLAKLKKLKQYLKDNDIDYKMKSFSEKKE